MVLIGRNTRCAICGEKIGSQDRAALRHFIRNDRDRLAVFSGRAFHRSCLDAHPLREVAMSALAQRRAWALAPCRCVVCGELVSHDGVTTDLLVSDEDHPLSQFNYLCFHSDHLAHWASLAEFNECVRQATLDGTWRGEPLIERR